MELYKDTRVELELIMYVLDKFSGLLDTLGVNSRRGRGGRGHPAAWWRTWEAARPRETAYDFCINDIQGDLCHRLETQLEETDSVVVKLQTDVNAWQASDLTELRGARRALEETYDEASADDTFTSTVDDTKFLEAIGDVKQVSVWREEGEERVT